VSAQALTDALWALLAAAILAAVIASHLPRSRLLRLSALARRFEVSNPRYLVLVLGWMWLGWHFFAR